MLVLLALSVAWMAPASRAQVAGDAAGDRDAAQPANLQGNQKENEKAKRLREGTVLEKLIGRFESTGDRVTFYPLEGMDSMRVLENLALERVARELPGLSRDRQWRVAGEITEYQGSNYLLVSRAVLQRNAGP